MDAATHFIGPNSPFPAQTAAEVIDAGMNESIKSAVVTKSARGFPSDFHRKNVLTRIPQPIAERIQK